MSDTLIASAASSAILSNVGSAIADRAMAVVASAVTSAARMTTNKIDDNIAALLLSATGAAPSMAGTFTATEVLLRGPGDSRQFGRLWEDAAVRYLACVTAGFSPEAFNELRRLMLNMSAGDRLMGVSTTDETTRAVIALHASLNGVLAITPASQEEVTSAASQLSFGPNGR